jgi:hypothetical protein
MTSTTKPNAAAAAIAHIEQLAKIYRETLDTLSERVAALNAEVQSVQNRRMPNIRLAVAATLDAQAQVIKAVDERREYFVKPRSLTLCGIKLGIAKGRGKTLWPKAEALLVAMRRVFSPATYRGLVIQTEEPNKEALKRLPLPELKKLGVEIIDAGDSVFAEPAESTVDKQVERLLAEATAEMAETSEKA